MMLGDHDCVFAQEFEFENGIHGGTHKRQWIFAGVFVRRSHENYVKRFWQSRKITRRVQPVNRRFVIHPETINVFMDNFRAVGVLFNKNSGGGALRKCFDSDRVLTRLLQRLGAA